MINKSLDGYVFDTVTFEEEGSEPVVVAQRPSNPSPGWGALVSNTRTDWLGAQQLLEFQLEQYVHCVHELIADKDTTPAAGEDEEKWWKKAAKKCKKSTTCKVVVGVVAVAAVGAVVAAGGVAAAGAAVAGAGAVAGNKKDDTPAPTTPAATTPAATTKYYATSQPDNDVSHIAPVGAHYEFECDVCPGVSPCKPVLYDLVTKGQCVSKTCSGDNCFEMKAESKLFSGPCEPNAQSWFTHAPHTFCGWHSGVDSIKLANS